MFFMIFVLENMVEPNCNSRVDWMRSLHRNPPKLVDYGKKRLIHPTKPTTRSVIATKQMTGLVSITAAANKEAPRGDSFDNHLPCVH